MLHGWRDLPPVFRLLWWGTLINRMGGFVVPLLTFYLTQARGVALDRAGEIVALYGVGQIGASLVGGVMADRLGRRTTLVVSLFAGAASMLGLGLVRAPATIAAMVAVTGFAGELYRPAVSAMVADVVAPADRVRAYGLLYWAVNLGFSIAPVLAGTIARWSYTLLFVVDAATTAAYGVLIALRAPETRPPAPPVRGASAGLGAVVRDRVFMTFVALAFLAALIDYQSTVSLSAHLEAQGHASSTFGAILAVNGVLIILAQPALNAAVARRDPSRVLAASVCFEGAGFFVHGLGAAVPIHVAAVCVWTIGEILRSGVSSSLVAALAPADARGRYNGVWVMSWGFASSLGPLVGARVLATWGPHVLWPGCLALAVIVAGAFLATAGPRRRRLATAP